MKTALEKKIEVVVKVEVMEQEEVSVVAVVVRGGVGNNLLQVSF